MFVLSYQMLLKGICVSSACLRPSIFFSGEVVQRFMQDQVKDASEEAGTQTRH